MTQIVYRPFGFRAISESAGVGNAENNDSSVARDSTNTDRVPSSVVDSRSRRNRPASRDERAKHGSRVRSAAARQRSKLRSWREEWMTSRAETRCARTKDPSA